VQLTKGSLLLTFGLSNYVAVFETDVYFLNTELKLIKLQLKLNGRDINQDSIVPIADPKIEDFYLEPVTVNGVKGCKIIYITDKGVIKEYGAGADPNKNLNCATHSPNVNYWNKVVKVGNCVLAAGFNNTTKENTLVLGEDSLSQSLSLALLIPPSSSTPPSP
jgi:hypothetical protein